MTSKGKGLRSIYWKLWDSGWVPFGAIIGYCRIISKPLSRPEDFFLRRMYSLSPAQYFSLSIFCFVFVPPASESNLTKLRYLYRKMDRSLDSRNIFRNRNFLRFSKSSKDWMPVSLSYIPKIFTHCN